LRVDTSISERDSDVNTSMEMSFRSLIKINKGMQRKKRRKIKEREERKRGRKKKRKRRKRKEKTENLQRSLVPKTCFGHNRIILTQIWMKV
jgi:hypothetical protein